MDCRHLLVAFSIAVLMLMPERILSQSLPRQNNLAVFLKLFDEVAESVTVQLATVPTLPIVLLPAEDQASAAYLLRARLVKLALEKGHAVFAKDSLALHQNYLNLAHQLLVCEMEYSMVKGGGLFRRSALRRKAVVEVDVEVTEYPAALVRLHDSFRAEFADTLRSSEIHQLEDPKFAFTVGHQPRESGWAKLMEPALLALAAGAAIYALYSLRTR